MCKRDDSNIPPDRFQMSENIVASNHYQDAITIVMTSKRLTERGANLIALTSWFAEFGKPITFFDSIERAEAK